MTNDSKKQTRPEIAQMLRTVNIGRKFSDEHKARIGAASKGRLHTEEAKNQMSLAHKGKVISEEHQKKLLASNQKKVSINGVVYNSMSEAAIANGISSKVVYDRLKSDKYPDFKRV